jgi:hypothetical protein
MIQDIFDWADVDVDGFVGSADFARLKTATSAPVAPEQLEKLYRNTAQTLRIDPSRGIPVSGLVLLYTMMSIEWDLHNDWQILLGSDALSVEWTFTYTISVQDRAGEVDLHISSIRDITGNMGEERVHAEPTLIVVCPTGQWGRNSPCQAVSECDYTFQYESAAPTLFSDRECTEASICRSVSYWTADVVDNVFESALNTALNTHSLSTAPRSPDCGLRSAQLKAMTHLLHGTVHEPRTLNRSSRISQTYCVLKHSVCNIQLLRTHRPKIRRAVRFLFVMLHSACTKRPWQQQLVTGYVLSAVATGNVPAVLVFVRMMPMDFLCG